MIPAGAAGRFRFATHSVLLSCGQLGHCSESEMPATSEKDYFTIPELAAELGAPAWLVRRVVDALGESIPRAGFYRLVPRRLLPKVKAALPRKGVSA
jgi:hypothetical protein